MALSVVLSRVLFFIFLYFLFATKQKQKRNKVVNLLLLEIIEIKEAILK
jgi:hypothetical protein